MDLSLYPIVLFILYYLFDGLHTLALTRTPGTFFEGYEANKFIGYTERFLTFARNVNAGDFYVNDHVRGLPSFLGWSQDFDYFRMPSVNIDFKNGLEKANKYSPLLIGLAIAILALFYYGLLFFQMNGVYACFSILILLVLIKFGIGFIYKTGIFVAIYGMLYTSKAFLSLTNKTKQTMSSIMNSNIVKKTLGQEVKDDDRPIKIREIDDLVTQLELFKSYIPNNVKGRFNEVYEAFLNSNKKGLNKKKLLDFKSFILLLITQTYIDKIQDAIIPNSEIPFFKQDKESLFNDYSKYNFETYPFTSFVRFILQERNGTRMLVAAVILTYMISGAYNLYTPKESEDDENKSGMSGMSGLVTASGIAMFYCAFYIAMLIILRNIGTSIMAYIATKNTKRGWWFWYVKECFQYNHLYNDEINREFLNEIAPYISGIKNWFKQFIADYLGIFKWIILIPIISLVCTLVYKFTVHYIDEEDKKEERHYVEVLKTLSIIIAVLIMIWGVCKNAHL